MALQDENFEREEELVQETWYGLPDLSPMSGSTIPTLGRRFFLHSPTTILKLGSEDGEGVMTALAHSTLGSCVPRVVSVVTVLNEVTDFDGSVSTRAREGLLLTRQPGTPLVEIWPSLISSQRETVKNELCNLLVRMRARRFTYYGRPSQKPYLFFTEFGKETHVYCTSRSEWDDSRVRALHASEADIERVISLERIQRDTSIDDDWDRPVLTHGDLSDRNILVDPSTLAVVGFLDWEMANIMPAYFEYGMARLCGGHQSAWRRELLDVLRSVLRHECAERRKTPDVLDVEKEEGYMKTLAAWNAMVDVERFAQGYNDDCAWTFETGMSDTSSKTEFALSS
ncbi:hypothetical protein FQN54_003215 [Arachnomyces sp. PD_36]|nr:hypothetical protein FQN54_003215 [Arachnomyces sp. PD_36]